MIYVIYVLPRIKFVLLHLYIIIIINFYIIIYA